MKKDNSIVAFILCVIILIAISFIEIGIANSELPYWVKFVLLK